MKNLLYTIFFSFLVCVIPAFANFSDVSSNTQFLEAITYSYQNNIVEGYSDGKFHPEKTINRGEFIKIIIEATVPQSKIIGSECFNDVNEEWFAKYICTAKNKGFVAGFENGMFKPDQNISFVEAAKIISLAFGDAMPSNETEWFKPFVLNLETKKAIPNTIQNFSYYMTRGDTVEMIWRVKEKKIKENFISYQMLKEKDISSFKADNDGNFYGTLTVTGYPVIKKKTTTLCSEDCSSYFYIYFQVLSENKALFKFLTNQKGNAFVGEKQIGLGCLENNIITYYNDSEELGMNQYNVSSELSRNILESNEQNPISITLTRLLFIGGSGAPDCYSHFTTISSVE